MIGNSFSCGLAALFGATSRSSAGPSHGPPVGTWGAPQRYVTQQTLVAFLYHSRSPDPAVRTEAASHSTRSASHPAPVSNRHWMTTAPEAEASLTSDPTQAEDTPSPSGRARTQPAEVGPPTIPKRTDSVVLPAVESALRQPTACRDGTAARHDTTRTYCPWQSTA